MNEPGAEPSSATGRRPRGALLAGGGIGLATLLVAVTIWSSGPPAGPGPSGRPSQAPPPSLAVTSPSASPTPAATTPSGSSNPNDPWGTLALEPLRPVAVITASRIGPAGVARDTAFTLTSLAGDDPVALARSVVVTPALHMTVAAGADRRTAILQPTEALAPGTFYRFRLDGPDATLAGSWAFQAAAPLRVVTTVPYDQATDVPVTTGIELSFDQDGALDAAAHFSIEPAVAGRFEQHGRTFVFVPERLEPATLYTVTLTRGIGLKGSDQVLEQDVVVRFETASPAGTGAAPDVTYQFGRPMVEAPTGERPILAVSIWADPDRAPGADTKPFDLVVYRLASEAAGIDAVRHLMRLPDWVRWSRAGLVPTNGLARVGAFTVEPTPVQQWGSSIRLPTKLPPGWYLVEIPRPNRNVQLVLQVTDIAAYVAAATDRIVIWANDIANRQPLGGASVEVLDGGAIGRTSDDGLLMAATPASIRTAATSADRPTDRPFLAVRASDGRSLVVPAGLAAVWSNGYIQDRWSWGEPEDVRDRLWLFMATDRQLYRPTDTVNVWGFVRERDTGRVPGDVELRLTSSACCWGGEEKPPITTVSVRPDPSGAFAQSIRISDLPYGGYDLQLWADGERIVDSWFGIELIRKPAYLIQLETDRHVLLAGHRVTLTARATFFDGTPVPGARLSAELFGTKTITTDTSGVAIATGKATADAEGEVFTGISVKPTRGEEGEIVGSSDLLVFPAGVRLEAEGTIEKGRVAVTGSLHQVAVSRLEEAWGTDAWETVDRNGTAVADARVIAAITELVPVRVKTRQFYDFIAKKVVDVHEYRIKEVKRGTRTLRTAAGGSLSLDFPATADHDYRILLSATDPGGRLTQLTVYATAPWPGRNVWSFVPRLEPGCGQADTSLAIGDAICLAAREDRGPLPSGGPNRYLFVTAQRGLRDAVVARTPEFHSRFMAADVPNLEVIGAWFTGSSVVPIGGYSVTFDPAERELTVELAADRERYGPGETVTVDVRTTDRSGRPVPAAVVLRAVDEKLFAMGAAYDPDPLDGLYSSVGSWLLWTHSSHPLPFGDTGGKGDTTGGGGEGGRQVFVDALLFRQVTTDADGRARISFRLSDDLTSWHVSAAAMTSVPEAGSASILVPVGLPFFVEATLAPEYLVSDEPILRLRAFGTGLSEGDPVTFTVLSTSLGLPRTTVRGTAFEDATLPLPALTAGEHSITISASSGGTATLSDKLTRRFTVVGSRLTETKTSYTLLTADARPEGGPGMTTYVFSDAGRGRYLSTLEGLAWSSGPRVDRALAAAIARDLLVGEFAVDRETLPSATFEPASYEHGGVALLPYSSPDLALTSRVALIAGERFSRDGLEGALSQALEQTNATRERRVLAYAGLAGLGEPVVADLRALAADPGLTIRERLYVALGFAALGDEESALAIERDLLAEFGQRRGPWIRLRVGESLDDTVEATSLLALLAAQLGDPLADDAEAYVDANPAVDELYSLQQVAFITRMLERTPSAAGRFAYTVDGRRTVVDLEPGVSFSLDLVEAQRRTLSFEPLAGQVGLATSWQVPIERESAMRDADLELARTYAPYPSIPDDAMAEVRLTATFGPQVVAGCHEVTDLVPSGLAPVERLAVWPDEGSATSSWIAPYRIEGQRVSFCVGPSKQSRTVKMRYFARIVTAGTYTWEPAVIQAAMAPESINLTTVRRVTIR